MSVAYEVVPVPGICVLSCTIISQSSLIWHHIILQIRAQLAAMGTPIIGDSAYMTAAMAAMANPSINPFGRERLSCGSEEEKEAAVEAWIASHGKEPKSVIGLQASEISWDYEGEHHYYKAGVPWWRQDSVESDLV
jgi:hypothetical protein